MSFGKRGSPPANGDGDARRLRPDATFGAAKELVDMVVGYYRNKDGVHAETAIGALATLFGEWSLRATGASLPETGWIVSGEVNAIMIEGPEALWPVVASFAARAGVAPAELPDPLATVARTVAAFGKRYPAISVPEANFPLEWSPVAGPRFRGKVMEIAARHRLAGKEIAAACAVALGMMLDMTRQALDPRIGVRLAQEVAFGAARMAPLAAVDPRFSPFTHAA